MGSYNRKHTGSPFKHSLFGSLEDFSIFVTLVECSICIYPLEYENGPTMRLELLGCPIEGKMQEN